MIEINLLLMSVDSLAPPTQVTFRLDFSTLLFFFWYGMSKLSFLSRVFRI